MNTENAKLVKKAIDEMRGSLESIRTAYHRVDKMAGELMDHAFKLGDEHPDYEKILEHANEVGSQSNALSNTINEIEFYVNQ